MSGMLSARRSGFEMGSLIAYFIFLLLLLGLPVLEGLPSVCMVCPVALSVALTRFRKGYSECTGLNAPLSSHFL